MKRIIPPGVLGAVSHSAARSGGSRRAVRAGHPSRWNRCRLANVIRQELLRNDGVFGVAVKDLATGQSAYVNADVLFPPASLYKTSVMYEFYRQKKAGRVSVDDVLTEAPYDYDNEGTNMVGLSGASIAAGTVLQLMILD